MCVHGLRVHRLPERARLDVGGFQRQAHVLPGGAEGVEVDGQQVSKQVSRPHEASGINSTPDKSLK